ncbi:dirigent protein 22-like [Dioscorea cayenensis subsp. rotundata]|uniref:Dirigent protein n=1 Tax=Dioscorea cayennensis subsp. rotundata TaxID=55577 RepID=A0AB40AZR3_DIOCR|nr:dirigent protein 22-like [Dioscorea cayenensis subsp. rotundata]
MTRTEGGRPHAHLHLGLYRLRLGLHCLRCHRPHRFHLLRRLPRGRKHAPLRRANSSKGSTFFSDKIEIEIEVEIEILGETQKNEKEKIPHFTMYWYDIVSGPNPFGADVARAPITNTSTTLFGLVRIIDNPLTKGPTMSSDLVGRAQGFYASTSLEYVGLMMVMNFAFTSGKYNGSTVTILSRNEVSADVREMSVIGGSGLFRWSQGYAQARTSMANMTTGDVVVKYDVHVMHY